MDEYDWSGIESPATSADDYNALGTGDLSVGNFGTGNQINYSGDTIAQSGQADSAYTPTTTADSTMSFPNWLASVLGSKSTTGTAATGTTGNTGTNSMLASLLSAGLAAYGANKQNQAVSSAQAALNSTAAANAATAAKYSSPLHLTSTRTATTPTARNGSSEWFTNNKLPTYAAGGPATDGGIGFGNNQLWTQYAQGGPALGPQMGIPGGLAQASQNYVRGGTAGQADKVPSALSHGEYVMDADTVASLGDGNNEAGALKLDQMRENIRKHKRSAPAGSIPPKAKSTQAYLRGTK